MLKKQLPAPYVPKVQSKTDLSNFDPEVVGTELAESVVPAESVKLIEGKSDAFQGFGEFASSKK